MAWLYCGNGTKEDELLSKRLGFQKIKLYTKPHLLVQILTPLLLLEMEFTSTTNLRITELDQSIQEF